MKHGSKYLTTTYPIPAGWTAEEFWTCVNMLESFDVSLLFDVAASLGIHYDERYRRKVDPGEIIVIILDEGGTKEEVERAVTECANRLDKAA